MTITSVRIYYYPRSWAREQQLTPIHWGFSQWFERRLKPIHQQLRGPEAKGVNIVNLLLIEDPSQVGRSNRWTRVLNTFQFKFVCDLRPLEGLPCTTNVEKLMQFFSVVVGQAPWPQVRALAGALAQPLSEEDRITLLAYLAGPGGTEDLRMPPNHSVDGTSAGEPGKASQLKR